MGDFGEESDDSDGEGGMGNLNRFIVRPVGHTGKAKRGHLCFDASFETGNLGKVNLVNEYEYDLYIRPDTCSPRFRFWFNFTVDNVKQDQRVVFNIVNMSKGRNLFNNQMTPLVKSTTRKKWFRIPKENVFYHKSSSHRNCYVLSFSFGFDREDEVFQFALAPPYSYSRLETFLSILESNGSAHLNDRNFQRCSIANSLHNRRLELITIGGGSAAASENRSVKKRIVAIMARVHPGESPTSLVCQGLLELLVSSNSIASILREHVVFKIFPMTNPDGVFVGNYRSSILGIDLNRSWNIANAFTHPTIHAILETLKSLDDNDEESQLDFVIDIHSHSSLNGCFIYGNTYDDVYRYERHILFPKLLSNSSIDYAEEHAMFNTDPNKIGTARRHLCSALSNKVNVYTLEISLYGYKLRGSDAVIPYTEESYKRCGMNLIKTFLEYYQCTGFIQVQPVKEIATTKQRKFRKKRAAGKIETLRSAGRDREPIPIHLADIIDHSDFERKNQLEPKFSQKLPNFSTTATATAATAAAAAAAAMTTATRTRESKFLDFRPAILNVQPEPTLSIIDLNETL